MNILRFIITIKTYIGEQVNRDNLWVFLCLKPVCEILVLHWSWSVLIDLRETIIMAISSKTNNVPFVNLYITLNFFL